MSNRKKNLHLTFYMSDEALLYLEAQSNIRFITPSHLTSLLLKTVCEDKLMLAILDDKETIGQPPSPRRKPRKQIDLKNGAAPFIFRKNAS